MTFSLPPEITMMKHELADGMAYNFRHDSLGELGRIVLRGTDTGECEITSEVAGDPSDPMTKKRYDIILPITEHLAREMDNAARAKNYTVPVDYNPLEDAQVLSSGKRS